MSSQPKIHLVRHAQGFHNLGSEFHDLHDPRLTPVGESQCAKLQQEYWPSSRQQALSLITASPFTRTLHTAFLTFAPALGSGDKCETTILAIPDAQETSDYPCDTGSDLNILTQSCTEHGWPVHLSLLNEDWNVKTMSSRYSPASDAINVRARDCRKFLRQKARELSEAGDDDVQIVLVTHGGYLHYLTNDWEDATKLSGTGWENTEYRTYEFRSSFTSNDDEYAYLEETEESRSNRGKWHPMPDPVEQKHLYDQMMKGWEDQGLQNPSKLGANTLDTTGQEPADQVGATKDADVKEEVFQNGSRPSIDGEEIKDQEPDDLILKPTITATALKATA